MHTPISACTALKTTRKSVHLNTRSCTQAESQYKFKFFMNASWRDLHISSILLSVFLTTYVCVCII